MRRKVIQIKRLWIKTPCSGTKICIFCPKWVFLFILRKIHIFTTEFFSCFLRPIFDKSESVKYLIYSVCSVKPFGQSSLGPWFCCGYKLFINSILILRQTFHLWTKSSSLSSHRQEKRQNPGPLAYLELVFLRQKSMTDGNLNELQIAS